MKRPVFAAFAAGALALAVVTPTAQMRVAPLDMPQGHTALGLALRHLANVGIVMEATAHPDDEDNGLLVMLNRGQGFRTTLVTATRGNGGQNEIGPEIFEGLGVLRTEELLALHRFDGAEQYFTRAVDFGFSFSIEETFEKWGRDEITADYVRMIRTIRPDVIFGMSPTGNNGGQHHNASAVISHDAYELAADPTKYPEQIQQGLRPWQAKKYYWTTGFGPPNANAAADGENAKICRINSSVYDELLGRTYSEIGTEARSMHKCQGMAQLLALPGPVVRTYRLVETTIAGQMQKDEKLLTDGIDSSIGSLAQFAGPRPSKDLVDGLASITANVRAAQQRFDAGNDDGAVAPLVAGLHAVRVLRAQLRAMQIDEAGKFEIEFRLRQKEREFQQAIIIAGGLRIDALADDGIVVPGQDVKLSLIVANSGAGEVAIKQAKFSGFAGDGACTLNQVTGQQGGGGGRGGRGGANAPPPVPVSSLKKDVAGRCDLTMKIPVMARVSEPYWHRKGEDGRYTFDADAPFGLPFRPTEFYGEVTLGFAGAPGGPAGEEVYGTVPVQYRYSGDIFSGEKRTELLVVPALSVRVSPEVAIIPAASLRQPPSPVPANAAGRGGRRDAPPAAARAAASAAPGESREVRVTVVNDLPGASESTVTLDLPQGWTSAPAQQPLKLARPDESQTLRFLVKPPIGTKAGEYHVRALVKQGGATYDRGYQVIEYPHIHRQHIYDAATTTIKVIDVNTVPNLTIGYVMGVGDQVPPAIEQLGARVEFINADDLAWGNLSRFDAIVTGVRAYERRADLRANNARLLDYVNNGGTVIVQYNKFEFNDAQYGPYPARVSNDRVTDEHAPVKIAIENDPLMNAPNRINEETWNGWVQERGLYFLGADHDSRYKDLLEMADPFEFNKGVKKGALVEAEYGKGRWVYVGLGLWRELPAGVDGAYQLLANLVALGKTANLRPPAPR